MIAGIGRTRVKGTREKCQSCGLRDKKEYFLFITIDKVKLLILCNECEGILLGKLLRDRQRVLKGRANAGFTGKISKKGD